MRKLFIAASAASGLAALGLFAGVGSATPVKAEVVYPWCSTSPDDWSIRHCSFTSLAQCRATISGIGGRCLVNEQARRQRDTRFLEAPRLRPNR